MAAPLTWGECFDEIAQPVEIVTVDRLVNAAFQALADALEELEILEL